MKCFLIFIIFLTFSKWGQGQVDIGKFKVGLSLSIEESDKRLFGAADKDNILARSPEIFGTFNYSLIATYRIFERQRLNIRSGMGISYELATFSRPIDQGYFYDIYPSIFVVLDEYHKWMVNLPLIFEIPINNKISLDLFIYNNLIFFKKINGSFLILFPMTETKLSFESSELMIGVPFNIGRMNIKPYFRALNVQKIDKAIFSIIGDPRVNKDLEFNNHFKLGISINMLL